MNRVVLDKPELENLKGSFNSRKYNRVDCSFDDMLELLLKPELTLQEVGEKLGTSRITVWRLYKKFFSKILPRRNGYKRMMKSKKIEKDFPKVGLVAHIRKLAEENGLEVRQRVVYCNGRPYGADRGRLIIEGKECRLHHLKRTLKKNPAKSSVAFHASVSVPDFHLVYVTAPRFPKRLFIIPGSLIKRGSEYYINLNIKARVRGKKPRINFETYENAWHLIKDSATI
jgi:hypothetical protein